jgi:hypothetical protein
VVAAPILIALLIASTSVSFDSLMPAAKEEIHKNVNGDLLKPHQFLTFLARPNSKDDTSNVSAAQSGFESLKIKPFLERHIHQRTSCSIKEHTFL